MLILSIFPGRRSPLGPYPLPHHHQPHYVPITIKADVALELLKLALPSDDEVPWLLQDVKEPPCLGYTTQTVGVEYAVQGGVNEPSNTKSVVAGCGGKFDIGGFGW